MKRCISWILAAVILLGIFPLNSVRSTDETAISGADKQSCENRATDVAPETRTSTEKSRTAMEGLAVTESGMQLVADVTVDSLLIDAGKTLDLNGYTLRVGTLVCFGSIIDTGSTGKVVGTVSMQGEGSSYMPVYDSVNGWYRFFAYELKNLGVRKDKENSVVYGFSIEFDNQEAYELLCAGNCGVDVKLLLAWGENAVSFGQSATYYLSEALIQQFASLQLQYANAQAAIVLTVTGWDTLQIGTELTVTFSVEAADRTRTADPLAYTKVDGNAPEEKPLLTTQMSAIFNIADNTEKEGIPADDPISATDFAISGGKYGYAIIPNTVYNPESGLVYINYTRHRDEAVNYPYDSTKVYTAQTLLNVRAGTQLQDSYVDMRTENTMFFTGMTKLKDGRIFCQNYMPYYLSDTTATTYSWIVDTNGEWNRVKGVLIIPSSLASKGPQPNSDWHRYLFTRCLIELDNGTLLSTMYGSYGTIMVESKDYGKTWNYRSVIAYSAVGLKQPYINTDGSEITWYEPAVTRCADGSLLCVMRTGREKPLWQCRSFDDGLTWTEPTLMPGLEGKSIYPHLVLLSNGVLAMATGVPGDKIYFSLDGSGYNWDYSITTYSGNTSGNSAITELDYDEKTGTVTLLAIGDRGFVNTSLAGIWGRLVTVTRNHIENPKPARAVLQTDSVKLKPEEVFHAKVNTVFDSDCGVISGEYTVRWESLTPDIASVDQTGNVTALCVGTAQIRAAVTWKGVTVMSNLLTVQIYDDNAMTDIQVTPSTWLLKINQKATLSKTAYNSFGEEIADGTVTWQVESEDPGVLQINADGSFRALKSGVTELIVTAGKHGASLSKRITIIVESSKWVTQDFESASFPENCSATSMVSISTNCAYSGTHSVYVNDMTTSFAPQFRFTMPESKGVVVEFMLYTESSDHSSNFGVGHPKANGVYDYTCNTAYVGLLYNKSTGNQGYQAYSSSGWKVVSRMNKIPHQQWNKIRLVVTVDKPAKLYVNDKYLSELPVAAVWDSLNTLCFSTGGSAYIGDSYYVDDIRYMVFE